MTERQAREVSAALSERMVEVGLRSRPDKTEIVYREDDNRRGGHEHTAFKFLGYTFTARTARNKHGTLYDRFLPAVSPAALKRMSQTVRSWRTHKKTGHDLAGLAAEINPVVAGWMNYYGRFHRSEMYPLLQRVNSYLGRWARNKYRRLRARGRVTAWWYGVVDRDPELFAHWQWARALSRYG